MLPGKLIFKVDDGAELSRRDEFPVAPPASTCALTTALFPRLSDLQLLYCTYPKWHLQEAASPLFIH
jgi:hypothetical protein